MPNDPLDDELIERVFILGGDATFRLMLIEALKRRTLVADQSCSKFHRRALLAAARLRMRLKSTS